MASSKSIVPDLEQLAAEALRALVAELLSQLQALREENAALKDEVARLKGLNGRPKLRPSGMEPATAAARGLRGKTRRRGRGAKTSRLVIDEARVLTVTPPPGARFKGYTDYLVQELRLTPVVIRYRRERWRTADGRLLVAPLPPGVVGHFGPELHRFVLMQHHQGQVTTERLTRLLNELGLLISKRQVLRLLNDRTAAFVAEAEAVLGAGLETARWLTVDDTGARHRAQNGVTTQIGDDRFTFFATSRSKSRRNFLELLRAGDEDYVINDAALAYMRKHGLAGPVIGALAAHPTRRFADQAAWRAHLAALGLTRLAVTPDPVKLATEGALWGSVCTHGRCADAVIVSDEAGQFRVGRHALCWVHAERLVHKLIPRNEPQRRAVALVRQLIWWFYADLKAYKRDPCPKRRAALRARFERIFRRTTGFVALDRLLARLHARREELLLALERPEIPLHTNGSENDLRGHVIKRKISGGTHSEAGRVARDALLGLLKTCRKLGVAFFAYLGDRLNVPGAPAIAPLPELVRARATA
ncbi:MAG TPA: transposase [Geminicoccaceae bacterium]|nr:transposase [Geminicoccaceae bacterium]